LRLIHLIKLSISVIIHTYGWFFRVCFHKLLWKVKTKQKNIYLTFDDGPVPEVTEFIIKELDFWNAKATFFCLGKQIDSYADIFQELVNKGHTVANHTYHHKKGFNIDDEEYFKDVYACEKALKNYNAKSLFRPPYGKMKFSQMKKLSEKYNIVMWHLLSGDFLPNMTPTKCFDILIKKTKKGSIVVLHDSVKCFGIVKEVLPKYLEYFSSKGYSFKAL